MPSYSKEYKAAAVSKLLPPLSRSVSSVCEEQGISKSALYSWLKQSQQQGISVSDHRNTADNWTGQAKLTAVIETATMSEAELSAYCRQKGLYPEQIQRWKEACLQGAGGQQKQEKITRKQRQDDQKTIKKLRSEVRRKDRVLAETTALLVLSKKLEALYGEDSDHDEDN